MNARGKDGLPRRSHIEASANGLVPDPAAMAELAAYRLARPPESARDVWATYLELDKRRSWDENGPVRFSWLDLAAFISVTGNRLGRWHIDTLFALEDAFYAIRAETKDT